MTAGRILVTLLAGALLAGPAASLAAAGENEDYVMRREDDATEVVMVTGGDDDDDDGDDTSRFTSGHDSNDRTGSGHTAVSRDRDRSRGDKTRDRTKDGPGASKRDWSGGHTNDRSRNDSR